MLSIGKQIIGQSVKYAPRDQKLDGWGKSLRVCEQRSATKVNQLSKQNYFPIVPQIQFMIYHFVAL